MNNTQQTGRITKDLELKYTTNRKPYVRFILAVRRKRKNAQGEYESDFFPVKVWDKLAERLVQTQGKGSLIGVSGRLESGSFEDPQSGKRIFTVDIIAEDIDYLEPKNAREGASANDNQSSQNNSNNYQFGAGPSHSNQPGYGGYNPQQQNNDNNGQPQQPPYNFNANNGNSGGYPRY